MATSDAKRRDNRRGRILDAAAVEFARAGYSATSVRDIAAAAGILPGSMYYHFASKEDLLAAVHATGIQRIKERVLAAIETANDPWGRLEAACAAHVETLHQTKDYGSVIATEFPHRHSPKLRARMIEERDDYENVFRRLIDDLPLPPGTSRKYFRLALIGAMAWSIAWYKPGEDTAEEIGRQIVNLFRPAEQRVMRLEGKVAVVTGAARGIGAACARRFAAEGAHVVIADILEEQGEATAQAIRDEGGSAAFVPCDTGDGPQARALVERTVARHGRIDVLVNNAAISSIADFLDVTEEDFDRVLRVNLRGYFLVGQAAAREMAAAGAGSIVNMSSVNGELAIDSIAPYVVSKGGVNQLTSVMALALAPKGVRVNAIGPGTILTEMAKSVITDEAAWRRILSRTPMGRVGQPEEIAGIAVFLASDDSSYVTGQVIYADGGRMRLNYTMPVDGDG